MNAAAQRVFEVRPAVREAIGLILSLVGPSGGGKTFSALRLATGIQRVTGGDIYFVDTENNRGLHYADRFKFQHVRFGAPFSPDDYLAAIQQCARQKASVIIVDSASHEHSGEGGVLWMHEHELNRMAGDDMAKRERVKLLAWSKPKAARQRLINTVLQLNTNIILCFRAKEKLKIVKGKDPEPLGWQPISGDEWMFEATLQCLLPPNSAGMPRWVSSLEGEKSIMKLPEQFRTLMLDDEGNALRLDEERGESLAQWAVGGTKKSARERDVDELVASFAKCGSHEEFAKLEKKRQGLWTKATPQSLKDRMKESSEGARVRLHAPAPPKAADWTDTLRGQTTLVGLEECWKGCMAAFNDNPPLECDEAYQLQREALGEAEGNGR